MMTNLWHKIKHWWKQLLFGTGVVGIAVAASVGGPGDIPCRADTTRPAHERMSECPIPAHERASFKGQEIAGKAQLGTHQRQNYDIEIVEVNATPKGVEVFARAWKDGKQIGFGKDGTVDIERFVIINPPVLVPDEAGDIVREGSTDRITGEKRPDRTLREDPQEAVLQVLEHNFTVMNTHGDGQIVQGKRGNTTTTVFPDADPESTSVDGFVINDDNTGASWNTVHDDDGSGSRVSPNDSGTTAQVIVRHSSGNFIIGRAFILFDTSGIDDADAVDSATVSLWHTSNNDEDNDAQAYVTVIGNTSPASDTALIADDYDQCGAVDNPTKMTNDQDITNITTGKYTVYTVNATGISNIDLAGITRWGVREGHDIEDVPIDSGSNNINNADFSTADETGTTQDPKLVVEHSAAAEPEPPQSQFWF